MSAVPLIRIRRCNAAPVLRDREWVLYWMIAARRPGWNYGLQRAVEWAVELGRPLLVLEALRCNYRWASERLHGFVLDGMADNAAAFTGTAALYYPYVEPRRSAGMGLLEALAARACVVVTDEYPCFFLPGMVRRMAAALPVAVEAVDSNGLLPLRAADRAFPTAYAFRRFLQKTLPQHLCDPPLDDPLARLSGERGFPRLRSLPREIVERWPPADASLRNGGAERRRVLAGLPIDHAVGPAETVGGARAARRTLQTFLDHRLARYREQRSEPQADVSSGLSPYLHFGHISVHEVLARLAAVEEWTPAHVGPSAHGKREGWWGMSAAAEAFLDELVTWREVGYNFCAQRDDYDRYESLPDWALRTLEAHAGDARPWVYRLEDFEPARTHDPLWNAAQMQIVREGRMHNYLRMLWGKKILEWTPHPRDAVAIMIHLNNKYGLDGRDPNSYSGIFWVLGRYDRPWAPERPVFGVVRTMSSANTARKFRVREYIARYAPEGSGSRLPFG